MVVPEINCQVPIIGVSSDDLLQAKVKNPLRIRKKFFHVK
jgi:hypothetical protein